jgi:hypothetical protein
MQDKSKVMQDLKKYVFKIEAYGVFFGVCICEE